MKKRILPLIITPIIGAILGYLFSLAMNYGWFGSKWQPINPPPTASPHLQALNGDSLWIRDDFGAIYYNENTLSCLEDCWLLVSDIPPLPTVQPFESAVTQQACAPAPPFLQVFDTISECRHEMWVDRSFIYVVRKDESIYTWRADIYGEWTFISVMSGVCSGAILLFIPTVFIVLFSSLLDWIDIRSKREQNPA